MFNEFLDTALAWIAANPGWVGLVIFLTALGESLAIVGLIIPGAIMMFGFGALIALGHVAFWPAFGWAVAGAVAGDGLSFWLGRTLHQRLRQLWPFSKHPDMLTQGERFFQHHGGKSILFGRFFGPVRAVIPAVAGMLDMPTGRYLLVNVFSALLWAPAYLLPGMVFGASLELASQVAWRLAVLIVLMIALLWLTVWTVRALFQLLQPRIKGWLKAFYVWSRNRPFIGPISASLLDPTQGEARGLVTLAVLLLGSGAFLFLLLFATGQNIPTALDQSLYHFLQDLRTPWADNLMTLVTELGDYQVYLPLTVAVFAWLYWRGNRSAAFHWLAALGFGLLMSNLFKWTLKVPRPVEIYQGISSYSFPSGHATLSTILFGFLAVLAARETSPAKRWLPYLTAALIVIPIAFSRLYLGVHWLTDTLAGLSLGLAWVTLLGLAYNRHPAPPVNRYGLLVVTLVTLVIADLLHATLHHEDDLQRYQVRAEIELMDRSEWWQDGWQDLPTHRIDFRGKLQQALVLQWATHQGNLERQLSAAGWKAAPPLTLTNAMRALNPDAELVDLPVLPRVHDGRHENVTWMRPGEASDTRWILRFWDTGVRLQPGDTMLWVGSLSLQGIERRMRFLSLAVYLPAAQSPQDLLAPTLKGLPNRTVTAPNSSAGITLVADWPVAHTLASPFIHGTLNTP